MYNLNISAPFPTKLITPIAIVGVTFLLFLLYDRWLLFLDFMNPIFDSLFIFVGSYIVCLVLIASAFIWGRSHTLARTCLLVGMMLALAFPLLLPFLYGQYLPYAKPAPGYEMQWITQPGNMFSSAFKNAQREHDADGCTYTLYGWSADNVLYYGSDCQLGFWQYDPMKNGEPKLGSSIPDIVKNNSSVDRGFSPSGGNIFYPQHPRGFDPATRFSFIVYEKVTSLDGRWVAAAIMSYYGPRDVVILGAEE